MNTYHVGFIGFGLIAGSIAHALKETDCDYLNNHCEFFQKKFTLTAFNYRGTTHPALERAKSVGLLDEITTDLSDFSKMDLVFLCAPVKTNAHYMTKLKSVLKKDCILTDVGSVKSDIQKAADENGLSDQFIGGHPMTGSEKTGHDNSSSRILENAYYILTPTEKTPDFMITSMTELIKIMSAIPIVLDPKEHDNITAAISHLPHIIASSLVNLVSNNDKKGYMQKLAAGGFKDITRIASSSADMWQDICMTNKDSILHFLDEYVDLLKDVRSSIANEDAAAIHSMFANSKEYRDSLPVLRNGSDQIYDLNVDIHDEPGAIAKLATLLANHSISIKNVSIVNNREFQDGVFHMEFWDEYAQQKAIKLLTKYQYHIC